LVKTILKERGVETLPRQLPRISNLQKDLVWWEKRLWEANSTLNYIQVHSPRHFLTSFTKRFGVMIECYRTQIQQNFRFNLVPKKSPPPINQNHILLPRTWHLPSLLLTTQITSSDCYFVPPTLISNHELLDFSHQLL
jgi:hypothetical protein